MRDNPLFKMQPTKSINSYEPYFSSPTIDPLNPGKILKLDANESKIPISKISIEYAHRIIDNYYLGYYPDPSAEEIRKGIAKRTGIKASNISIGNGSEEIIRSAFHVFLNPDQGVAIPQPSFILFEKFAKLFNANLYPIQIRAYQDRFSYSAEDIISETQEKNVRVVIICSPNNPTGNSMATDEIKSICEALPNTLILVDQVYENPFGKTCINLIQSYKNIVLVRSFSKRIGLPGIRVGFAIGPESLCELIDKVKLRYGVNQVSQSIALGVLKDYDYYRNEWNKIENIRDETINKINKENDHFFAYSSKANFFLLRTDNERSHSILQRELLKQQIHIKNLKDYHYTLELHSRITVTTKRDMEIFLSELEVINQLLS